MQRTLLSAFAAFIMVWAAAPPAHAESGGWFGGAVDVPDREGDAMIAAGAVTIAGRVRGDALIAAGQVRVNGDIEGDSRVLSGEYHQIGDVAGELATASGKVEVDGAVGDDLYVAAEQVRLGSTAHIGRNARVTGREVLIKGRIDGDLDVRGETVAISAQVGGDVTIRAKRIILGPQTTIEGKLDWRAAEEPDIATDAIISHGASGSVVSRWGGAGWYAWDRPWRAAPREAIFTGATAARLMLAASAFLIGAFIVLLAPRAADAASIALRRHWLAALGWGALIAALTPFVSLLLILTIVAIPLGLLGLLSAPLLALFGYSAGAAALGGLALSGERTPPKRILAVAGAVLALAALAFLPWLGTLASVAAMLVGIGIWIVLLRGGAAQAASASVNSAMRDTAA